MLPTGNADLENYARMEHEGVTSPCSFFFPPLSGCDQPRPKGQPIPTPGYLVSDIKQIGGTSLVCFLPGDSLQEKWNVPQSGQGVKCRKAHLGGKAPFHMPQLDAAHDPGRKVAPSMRHQPPGLNPQTRGNRRKRDIGETGCLAD